MWVKQHQKHDWKSSEQAAHRRKNSRKSPGILRVIDLESWKKAYKGPKNLLQSWIMEIISFLLSSLETWKGQIINLKEVTMNSLQMLTSVWHRHLASGLVVLSQGSNTKSPLNTYWLNLNYSRDLHWFLYHLVLSE